MKNLILILYFLLFFFNVYCMIKRKKSKLVMILTYAMLLFLFMNNMEYGDARTYRRDYEQLPRDVWEKGYVFLKTIAQSIGIKKYSGFLCFLFLFSSVFFRLGFKAMKINCHVMFSLTMLFLCPWLSVVIRFFSGLAIGIFAMQYFFRGMYLKYITWVLIGIVFHKSTAVFLLVMFIKVPYKKLIIKKDKLWRALIGMITVISISVVMVTILKKQFIFAQVIVSTFRVISATLAERANIYMSRITRFGAIPVFLVHASNCWLAYQMRKKAKEPNAMLGVGSPQVLKIQNMAEIAWRVCLIFIVFLPLDVLSVNFGRLNIVPTAFDLVVFCRLYETISKKRFRKIMLAFWGVIITWSLTGWVNFDINIFDYVEYCGLFSK